MIYHLSNFAQRRRRNVFPRAFCEKSQQPDSTLGVLHVVNDAQPAALAHASARPAQLAYTTRAGHNIALGRLRGQLRLQRCKVGIVEVVLTVLRKRRQFDKRMHLRTVRQWRIAVNWLFGARDFSAMSFADAGTLPSRDSNRWCRSRSIASPISSGTNATRSRKAIGAAWCLTPTVSSCIVAWRARECVSAKTGAKKRFRGPTRSYGTAEIYGLVRRVNDPSLAGCGGAVQNGGANPIAGPRYVRREPGFDHRGHREHREVRMTFFSTRAFSVLSVVKSIRPAAESRSGLAAATS
jgi:hypothetical protein